MSVRLLRSEGIFCRGFFLSWPLTELTRELADSVFSRLVKHRPVPALDLKTVPDNGKVLCVITSLLSSEKEADALAAKIRNCCFSNRGENVNFGLLCDLREADSAVTADDGRLISYTEKLIDRLNSEHGCGIFLFGPLPPFCSDRRKIHGLGA